MRVVVRRSGGVAGITRQGTGELSDALAADLLTALDAAATSAPGPQSDAFTYQVTVDARKWTVREHALPADARHTLEEVLRQQP